MGGREEGGGPAFFSVTVYFSFLSFFLLVFKNKGEGETVRSETRLPASATHHAGVTSWNVNKEMGVGKALCSDAGHRALIFVLFPAPPFDFLLSSLSFARTLSDPCPWTAVTQITPSAHARETAAPSRWQAGVQATRMRPCDRGAREQGARF